MQEWRNWNTRLLQTQNPEGSTPSSCTLCPGDETGKRSSLRHLCSSSLRVRLPSWVLCCDATIGNGPVLKTGDPSCGLGVRGLRSASVGPKPRSTGPRGPSHSAMETWLNWQKHFPAKEEPGDRHAGSRPAVSVWMLLKSIFRKFIP